jgi:hypothetical protein
MRYSRSPQVVVRSLQEGEGAVALHLQSGAYHGLNDVGALVWEMLEEPRTADELVAGIREHIPTAPPDFDADVRAFLDALAERGLVETTD